MSLRDDFLPVDTDEMAELAGGNIYKAISVIGKRSNQITVTLKEELTRKLAEFAPAYDNLEEVMENKEQIEISRVYEKKPKATQIALEEYMENKIYWRDPSLDPPV